MAFLQENRSNCTVMWLQTKSWKCRGFNGHIRSRSSDFWRQRERERATHTDTNPVLHRSCKLLSRLPIAQLGFHYHRRACEMARPSSKHASVKLVLICLALLGFALMADFMWASSSRVSYSLSIASNWAPPYHSDNPIAVPRKPDDGNLRKVSFSFLRFLSSSFSVGLLHL